MRVGSRHRSIHVFDFWCCVSLLRLGDLRQIASRTCVCVPLVVPCARYAWDDWGRGEYMFVCAQMGMAGDVRSWKL